MMMFLRPQLHFGSTTCVPGMLLSALQSMILSRPHAIGYYYYAPCANEDPGLMEVNWLVMQPEWGSWDLKPGCLSDTPAQLLLQPWLRTCWRKSTAGLPRPWGACPTLSLCLLQTCHPDFISSNTSISFQPQGLCTCYSFCLGRPFTYSLDFPTSAYPSGLQ